MLRTRRMSASTTGAREQKFLLKIAPTRSKVWRLNQSSSQASGQQENPQRRASWWSRLNPHSITWRSHPPEGPQSKIRKRFNPAMILRSRTSCQMDSSNSKMQAALRCYASLNRTWEHQLVHSTQRRKAASLTIASGSNTIWPSSERMADSSKLSFWLLIGFLQMNRLSLLSISLKAQISSNAKMLSNTKRF